MKPNKRIRSARALRVGSYTVALCLAVVAAAVLLNVLLAQARALRDVQRGSRVTVTVEGRDEEAAVAAIQNFFVANM